MKNIIRLSIIAHTLCTLIYASAAQDYNEINKMHPFALSVGVAMSQTHHTENTAHPKEIRKALAKQAQLSKDPYAWLLQHQGYVLKTLPAFQCNLCGYQLNLNSLDTKNDTNTINNIILNIVQNLNNQTEITFIKDCPLCKQTILQPLEQSEIKLTPKYQNALVQQIANLGVLNQTVCTKNNLPACRISIETTDVLKPGTIEFDETKLQEQSQFLTQLQNPLVFCHHYANPQSIASLFETLESIEWFAKYCARIAEKNPNISYMCPISQPVAFSFHLARATLPPFTCSVDQKTHLKIIKQAQVAASHKIKTINPNIKVLMSHQWKCFKTAHGPLHPWYYIEYLCSCIADRMYNQAFVNMLKDCQDDFDGIALSVYPGITFNGITPEGNNCTPYFNEQDAFNAIMQTHKAFPNKEIFIVETGCNTTDPQQKKDFIDMTLRVCKQACEQGVKISGVYFWGITNDPEFYSEWGMQPESTHFGPYDRLNPDNPCDSINAAGIYIREILSRPPLT